MQTMWFVGARKKVGPPKNTTATPGDQPDDQIEESGISWSVSPKALSAPMASATFYVLASSVAEAEQIFNAAFPDMDVVSIQNKGAALTKDDIHV